MADLTVELAGLRLKTYYAGYTKITDRSLGMLSRMSTLERIELEGCHAVTDAGVRQLARLSHLRTIRIESCRNVTRAGVTGFAPGVRVSYSSV